MIGLALLGAVGLSGGVAGLYALRARVRRQLLGPVALRLGGSLRVPAFLEPPDLELEVGGHRLRITRRKYGRGSCEALELELPPRAGLELDLAPRARWPAPAPRWTLGDGAFDALFAIVQGAPAEAVRALLDGDVRRRLVALCGLRRQIHLHCVVGPHGMVLRRLRGWRDADELAHFIEQARPIFARYVALQG